MPVLARTLSFTERMYLPIVKGLFFTFRVLFRKHIVRMYPEVGIPRSAATRGQPRLSQNEDGTVRCVACGLCEFVCPAYAITIHGAATERFIEREPREFEIDMLRCILCGFCEEACPKEAIYMSDELEHAGPTRAEHVMNKTQLLRPISKMRERIGFANNIYNRWRKDPLPVDPKINPANAPAVSPIATAVPRNDPTMRPLDAIASTKTTR
ncbi:MAG: NADH-quinone oxidoreductase subunit I [Planctomycetes bacterium]|nr:NADH-quinone oxidoreductase subunit I [Planctomycetota bacterium]